MATEFEDDFDDDGNDDGNGPKQLRRRLRELEKQSNEQAEQLQKYRQKEAFSDAQLGTLSTEQRDALLKLVAEPSADAYRKTAEALRFVAPEPEVPTEIQAATERIAQAAVSGQTNATTSKVDEYASAQTPEEVIRIAQKHGSATTWDVLNA